MNEDIRLKIEELNKVVEATDTYSDDVKSILDLSLSDEELVFLNYTVNNIFLNYLDSVNKSCFYEKCKNNEIYKLFGIENSSKCDQLFELSSSLFDMFKNDEFVSSSIPFDFLNDFIKFYDSKNSHSVKKETIIEYDNEYTEKIDLDIFNTDNSNIDVEVSEIEHDDSESSLASEDSLVLSDDINTENLEDTYDDEITQSDSDSESIKDNVSKKSVFNVKCFIICLLILIIIALYLVLLNINKKNSLISAEINKLNSSSIQEKKEYVKELRSMITKNRDVLSEYDAQIHDVDVQIAELNSKNEELSNTVLMKEDSLSKKISEYESIKKRYADITTVMISNVITFNQYPTYPNGCEAVALYILLRYYDVSVSVDDVMDSLPIGNVPYDVDGVLFGGDPNYEFLGDPRSDDGWGIYDQGLSVVANKYKSGIINGTGMDFNDVFGLIKSGRPVIVWTSIDLSDPYISGNWISDKTGETIYWKRYNHALVVIGYNDFEVIVSDPINGQIRHFDREKFIYVYDFMGRRALYY